MKSTIKIIEKGGDRNEAKNKSDYCCYYLSCIFFAAYQIWTMAKEEKRVINYRQKLKIINQEIENLEKKTPEQYYQETWLKLMREKVICLQYISEV